MPISPILTPKSEWSPEKAVRESPSLHFNKIRGVGIDIVSVPRIARLVKRYDRETLTLLFAPHELDWCQSAPDKNRAFSLCFAAKEAVGKALKTGLAGIGWHEIAARLTGDRLAVELSGAAQAQAQSNKIDRWQANWDAWDNCVAVCVLAF